MKKFVIIISILLLTGCERTRAGLKDDFKENTRPYRTTAAQWIYPEVDFDANIPPDISIPPVYCYKTWEKPVCTREPQPGQEYHQIGN